MHIWMPVVSILGVAPVTEQKRRHRNIQNESDQSPQSCRAPGCAEGKEIVKLMETLNLTSIFFYLQIAEERHDQVDSSVNGQSTKGHIA